MGRGEEEKRRYREPRGKLGQSEAARLARMAAGYQSVGPCALGELGAEASAVQSQQVSFESEKVRKCVSISHLFPVVL